MNDVKNGVVSRDTIFVTSRHHGRHHRHHSDIVDLAPDIIADTIDIMADTIDTMADTIADTIATNRHHPVIHSFLLPSYAEDLK